VRRRHSVGGGGGGGEPISYDRRQRRQENVGGGGAAAAAHSSGLWANSRLTRKSFFIFSLLHHVHRSHFWTHPQTQYVIVRRFRQGSAFGG